MGLDEGAKVRASPLPGVRTMASVVRGRDLPGKPLGGLGGRLEWPRPMPDGGAWKGFLDGATMGSAGTMDDDADGEGHGGWFGGFREGAGGRGGSDEPEAGVADGVAEEEEEGEEEEEEEEEGEEEEEEEEEEEKEEAVVVVVMTEGVVVEGTMGSGAERGLLFMVGCP